MVCRKIIVFGGSGATGKALINAAIERGLKVTTLVRNSSSARFPSAVEVITGDLTSDDHLDRVMEGSDAVIILFGPRPPYTDIFCRDTTSSIISAMKRAGIKRLICQTGAMIGHYQANRTLPFRIMTNLFNRRMPTLAADRSGQEQLVMESGLDWTIIKPPRLTDGKDSGRWTAGEDVRVGLLSSITRGDLSRFILDMTFGSNLSECRLFIKN